MSLITKIFKRSTMKNLISILCVVFLVAIHGISNASDESQDHSSIASDESQDDHSSINNDASDDMLWFVSIGYIFGVKKLFDTGRCDVNYVNDNGDTAIMIAARRNDLEMMRLLLITYGAKIDAGAVHEYLMRCAEFYYNDKMIDLINNHTLSSK
jgi:ankyrin repeat protein